MINPQSGLLTFIQPKDFESPSDHNQDNLYEISITASDGISNVNLFIPSQNIGTATGSNGSFHLAFQPNDNVKLNISHIGYSPSTLTLNGQTRDIVIELNETFFQLDDVVVTSTRTEKLHKNVPVATEIISKKDILDS